MRVELTLTFPTRVFVADSSDTASRVVPYHLLRMNLPCVQCGGTCCKSHDGILLDDGTTMLFEGDQCPFLGDDGLCTIYDIRPRSCRKWMCHEQPGFLRTHPQVATLLTVNNIPLPT